MIPKTQIKGRGIFQKIAMQGSYSDLLQVRVPRDFLSYLKDYAKAEHTSLPGTVREILSFYLYPYFLERYIVDIYSVASIPKDKFYDAIKEYKRRQIKFANDAGRLKNFLDEQEINSKLLLDNITDLEKQIVTRRSELENKMEQHKNEKAKEGTEPPTQGF